MVLLRAEIGQPVVKRVAHDRGVLRHVARRAEGDVQQRLAFELVQHLCFQAGAQLLFAQAGDKASRLVGIDPAAQKLQRRAGGLG